MHNISLPSLCKRGKRTTGFCLYSILHVYSHNTSIMSRKPKHMKCLYRIFPQNITQKWQTALYGSGKCKGLLFVGGRYCCFLKLLWWDSERHSFNGITLKETGLWAKLATMLLEQKYTKGYWSQKGIFPMSWPTAMWAWAHSSLSSKEKTECSSGNTYLIHLANCSLILWEMIQVENRWGSMTPLVQGRLKGFKWVKAKWLNSHFAVEHIYWNPLVFGSCSDVFVTYDNLTPCKAHKEQKTLKPAHLSSKNYPRYTSGRTHWPLDNTALRLIHCLLYQVSFKLVFSMGKWETRGLFEDCLGHTGKQLRRVLEIFPRSTYCQPQWEHEAARLPKLSQGV